MLRRFKLWQMLERALLIVTIHLTAPFEAHLKSLEVKK